MSQSLVEDAPAARKAADHDDLTATLRDDEDRLDTTTMAPAGVAAIVAAAIASVAAIVARVQRQPVSTVGRGSGKSPIGRSSPGGPTLPGFASKIPEMQQLIRPRSFALDGIQ